MLSDLSGPHDRAGIIEFPAGRELGSEFFKNRDGFRRWQNELKPYSKALRQTPQGLACRGAGNVFRSGREFIVSGQEVLTFVGGSFYSIKVTPPVWRGRCPGQSGGLFDQRLRPELLRHRGGDLSCHLSRDGIADFQDRLSAQAIVGRSANFLKSPPWGAWNFLT